MARAGQVVKRHANHSSLQRAIVLGKLRDINMHLVCGALTTRLVRGTRNFVNKESIFPKHLRIRGKARQNRGRKVRFQQRKQIEADGVAQIFAAEIGTIGHERQAFGVGEGVNLLPRDREQRPDDAAIDRLNAAQAAQPHAANQPGQHSFRLIVGVMRGGDFLRADAVSDGFEKLIPHSAGGVLRRKLVAPNERRNIARVNRAGKRERCRELSDKFGIPRRFVAAKLVIQMRDMEANVEAAAQPMQDMQEDNGIRAAGDADDDEVFWRDEMMLANAGENLFIELLLKCAHSGRLPDGEQREETT